MKIFNLPPNSLHDKFRLREQQLRDFLQHVAQLLVSFTSDVDKLFKT